MKMKSWSLQARLPKLCWPAPGRAGDEPVRAGMTDNFSIDPASPRVCDADRRSAHAARCPERGNPRHGTSRMAVAGINRAVDRTHVFGRSSGRQRGMRVARPAESSTSPDARLRQGARRRTERRPGAGGNGVMRSCRAPAVRERPLRGARLRWARGDPPDGAGRARHPGVLEPLFGGLLDTLNASVARIRMSANRHVRELSLGVEPAAGLETLEGLKLMPQSVVALVTLNTSKWSVRCFTARTWGGRPSRRRSWASSWVLI